MNIKSFAELVAGDEMAGRFWIGFDTTGYLKVEASCEARQHEVGSFDLDASVPEEVREYFERIRTLHVYGAFYYGFFSLVASLSLLAIELALKSRLRELHPAEVGIIEEEHLTELWHRAQKDGLLVHRTTAEFVYALENYLDPAVWSFRSRRPFSVDRYDQEAVRELRNDAAHPSKKMTVGPPDSARDIQWLARFINSLWGPMPVVPFEECKRLAGTITAVVATADAGDPITDFQRLRCGLIQARKKRDSAGWGEEMVERWEQTMAFYVWRYGQVVLNAQGVPFLLRMGQCRKINSSYEDPADPQIRYAPGTEVELVGPGENLSERPDGQRVRICFPNGTEIDWPALDLLTEEERAKPKTI